MILLDANVLIYAHDETSPQHQAARRWFENMLNEPEEVAIALVSILAFLRVMTSPAIFDQPLAVANALEIVTEWLNQPNVGIVQPTLRHWELLAELARTGRARGPMLMDAHIAALAIEHGATLCTSDRDFSRFRGLRVQDPLGD